VKSAHRKAKTNIGRSTISFLEAMILGADIDLSLEGILGLLE